MHPHTEPAITAIRGLLDTLERDLADQTARANRLDELNTQLTARLKDAHHDLALIQNNLSEDEPRPAVEYLTAVGFVTRLQVRRDSDHLPDSLSQALGARASRIGKLHGVLPIEIPASTSSSSRTKAWPAHVWQTALAEWESSKEF